jgi:CubicO group peptidase (beta-lactamase class C family)
MMGPVYRNKILSALREEDIQQQLTNLTRLGPPPESVFGVTATVTSWQDKIATSKHANFGSSIAEKDKHQEITPDTLVGIGSATKMFTAATILKMIENKLFAQGLDTKLYGLIPALEQRYGKDSDFIDTVKNIKSVEDITLRDLLLHTHGMGCFTSKTDAGIAYFKGVESNRDKSWRPDEIFNKKYLRTETCKYGEFNYSNAGYVLLGAIIEAASGKSYEDAVRDLVIKPLPLELKNTKMGDEVAELFKRDYSKITKGFEIDASGELHQVKNLNHSAEGGIWSTPEDMNTFVRAFLTTNPSHSLFKELATINAIQDSIKNSIRNNNHGLGCRVFPAADFPQLIGHPGGVAGFESHILYDPVKDKAFSFVAIQQKKTQSLQIEEQISPPKWQNFIKQNGEKVPSK